MKLTIGNALPVTVTAVAMFGVGFLWYSDKMFGKEWRKLSGIKDSDMKKAQKEGMQKQILFGFLATFFMTLMMDGLVSYMTMFGGMVMGFWLWLGFIVPVLLGSVLWERKPVKLFAINAGHYLVILLLLGLILSVW